MRHDMDIQEKIAKRSNIKTILNVAQINYHFIDKKTRQLENRVVYIIGNSERDCLKTIEESLPVGTKWAQDSFQTIYCTIDALTPTIRKLLFDELSKEFETETKKGLFTKKGKK